MNAACAYRNVHRASLVESKTPHELTLMLFDGALSRIETARELDPDVDGGTRHRAIERALAIVHELQGVLRDPGRDPLARDLFALYGHIIERLLEADRSGEVGPLEAAGELLDTLRDGWAGIAPSAPH